MPPGQYYIFANAALDQFAVAGYYGSNEFIERAVVTVTAGAVLTDLDINLGLSTFEGVIAGQVTAGGQPGPPAAFLPLVVRQIALTPPFSATVLVDSYVYLCPDVWCAISDAVLARTVVNVIGCDENCTWYQLEDSGWVMGGVLAPQPSAGRATP